MSLSISAWPYLVSDPKPPQSCLTCPRQHEQVPHSPVNRLPNEIIYAIFDQCSPTILVDTWKIATSLRSVCKLWYGIAENCPSLWHDVRISLSKSNNTIFRLIELWFKKSHGTRFLVTVDRLKAESRAQVLKTLAHALLRRACGCTLRITVQSSYEAWYDGFLADAAERLWNSPQVEALGIEQTVNGRNIRYHLERNASEERCAISGRVAPMGGGGTWRATFRHKMLTHISFTFDWGSDLLWAMKELQTCESLHALSIRAKPLGAGRHAALPSFHHPKLESLSLHLTLFEPGLAQSIVSAFRLPALKYLAIALSHPGPSLVGFYDVEPFDVSDALFTLLCLPSLREPLPLETLFLYNIATCMSTLQSVLHAASGLNSLTLYLRGPAVQLYLPCRRNSVST
ncbi:hypothetical protein HYDPIDRAFT_26463 [Hydnomerulius pinastri MD-312]|nr:hypothetical protein HYDPIDRAFT_26463 [Hydnomerulius pinastri MD-312]